MFVPWNRLSKQQARSDFCRRGKSNVSLAEVLELTRKTYAERFRHSAMKRASFQLQRNARRNGIDDREQPGAG